MKSFQVVLTGAGAPGTLRVAVLPGAAEPLEKDPRTSTLIIREARSYRFEFDVAGQVIEVQPAELFDFDDATCRSGRLMPREAVGAIRVEVTTDKGRLTGEFDVRSAKFADEEAFGRMLSDLAELAIESLHQGFAASAGRFGTVPGAPPRLLYQQFAVLKGLLDGTELRWALGHVLAQPHRSWEPLCEYRRAGRALRGSSSLSRQLAAPGRRVHIPTMILDSLPAQVCVERTVETVDTVPNRYLRFVLESWRALAESVFRNVQALQGSARMRGEREAAKVREELDELLASPLFREVRPLSVFPGDNQVLRRRDGYRQVAAAAALIDGSLGLEIELEDPLLVSRRSVATLYEYWTFTRLAQAVAAACGSRGWQGELFRKSPSGMSLVLNARGSTRLQFDGNVDGQQIVADLMFNKEFGSASSWTRPMRPDASLLIRRPNEAGMWLHFDAKYKVDWARAFETGEVADEEEVERHGESKRTDLLKMHAYRDAIRDSAGSYVLFPGSHERQFAFDSKEFLPGLGAFPLRPDSAEQDIHRLKSFIRRAMIHTAGDATRHRRASYWARTAYEGPRSDKVHVGAPRLPTPPADTPVLVGYVRSEQQWQWITDQHLYNVRSGARPGAVLDDAPELAAQLLLLFHRDPVSKYRLVIRTGAWRAVTRSQMEHLHYPQPRGDTYLVAPVEELNLPEWFDTVSLDALRPHGRRFGAPFTASWLDLVLSTQDSGGLAGY